MVKIQEETSVTSGNGLDHKTKETLAQNQELPGPNLELVAEARKLLKRDYESNLEESKQLYSKYHYDELMEPNAPLTCWRYILHRDENVQQAVELMKQTLVWRKENRIDTIKPKDLIKDIWLRAPIGFVGQTRDGHDLIYAIGKNYRKPDSSIKQLVRDFIGFLLFEWDRKHRYDMKQCVIAFDVSDTTFRNMDLDFSAWLVSLRDYVPSRVKAIYIIGIPYLLRPVIRLIISWLPEKYRQITHCGSFEELVSENIDEHNLPEEIGGKADNNWRLAPIETPWIHDSDLPDSADALVKIANACSFNVTQDKLDELYGMQREYERKCAPWTKTPKVPI